MALLTVAAHWAERSGRELVALTVDHGLRSEAADEARFAASAAQNLGLSHETLVWSPPGGHASQAEARQARHALLAQAIRGRGGGLILTGHTADDQAETVLIRARQGSAWYGLAGMRPVSASPAWPDGRDVLIARPLLQTRRERLRQRLAAEAQEWREDPTNLDPRFERVRVRRRLAETPGLFDRIARIQGTLGALRDAADARIADWLEDRVAVDAYGMATAPVDDFAGETLTRALSLVLMSVAGGEAPPDWKRLKDLAGDIASGGPATRRTLGGAWIDRRGGSVRIGRDPGGAAAAGAPGPGVWDGRFRIGADRPKPAGSAPAIVRQAAPFQQIGDLGADCLIPGRLNALARAMRAGAGLAATLRQGGVVFPEKRSYIPDSIYETDVTR